VRPGKTTNGDFLNRVDRSKKGLAAGLIERYSGCFMRRGVIRPAILTP
jgi:hypothetical protein